MDADADADANERSMFLPGEASDSEDDKDDTELKRTEERRRMLGSSVAQISRLDISNGDGYHHMGNGDGGDPGSMGDPQSGRGGGLSSKAGIILVSRMCCLSIPKS